MDSVSDLRDRLETTGIGAPNPNLPSETQRKATARDAALLKARYEMSMVIRGLVLRSGITVAAAAELDPTLDERVKSTVYAAEIRTEFTPDDGCVVSLRLSKSLAAKELGVHFR
jgi:hypothetical protein